MTIAGDGFEKSLEVVLSDLVANLWSPSGAKFIVHALATKNMTMKEGEFGEVRLVQAIKETERALIMMDIQVMGEIHGALTDRIRKYENMNPRDDKDTQKMENMKKIRTEIDYCRQSALKE